MAMESREADADRIRDGLRLFNEERFFEAHEVLEEVWHRERGDSRTFLQGLIQICAAYHHFQNGNRTGAANLLRRGTEKMERHPRLEFGFDAAMLVAKVRRDAERIEQMHMGGAEGQALEFPKILGFEARTEADDGRTP